MMTIKHVTDHGESVDEARSVRSEYGGRPPGAEPTKVYADLNSDITASYDGGIVYVMNLHGATVAKYDMRPSVEPRAA